jgi:hypothetical protein
VSNHPYHIFGHVALKQVSRVKNKINIDTGCVQGNELTSVMLDSWRPMFKHQKALTRNERLDGHEALPIFEQQLVKHQAFMEEQSIQLLILDGELLPWRALGEVLIDQQFRTIEKALETELAFLKQNGFDQHLAEAVGRLEATAFEKEQQNTPKKELSKKYGDATYQTFKNLLSVKDSIVPIEQHQEAFASYKEQLELFGYEAGLEFKPFSILKIVKTNGEEVIPSMITSDMFRLISDDEFL